MTRTEYLVKVMAVISGADVPESLPVTAPIVAMFARDYEPAEIDDPEAEGWTSMEISGVLEDICALTTTDVAVTMAYLGFRLRVNPQGGHEWALRKASAPCEDGPTPPEQQ